MVAVSGNTGLAPLMALKYPGIVRSTDLLGVKRGLESKIRCQIRRKLRPV